MADDVDKLRLCLGEILGLVKTCLEQTRTSKDDPKDHLLETSKLNNEIYTFDFVDSDEDPFLKLTIDVQSMLQEHLPRLSQAYSSYFLDFLQTYQFDDGRREFTAPLSRNNVNSFRREFKGLVEASIAYPAALNGEIDRVIAFLKEHPIFTDKPGLWKTTLLYSAARNGHLELVKYLIEKAHCPINAQNQRDVNFALDNADPNFKPQSMYASTALHGACFNNHLSVVKYLVDHGADYFLKNQAFETPIENGVHQHQIRQYFQDYLLLNFSTEMPTTLPNRTILDEEQRPMRDSIWEYKPFQDEKWYKFNAVEAVELHKALLPSEKFQQDIHLRLDRGLYHISMLEFLRSGKYEEDPQKNMAWVRCRGSRVLNFDCLAVWQLMLIKHSEVTGNPQEIPSLKIYQFPNMHQSDFDLRVHVWYQCEWKTNAYLDDSMNYRRKIVPIQFRFVGRGLKLNLQTFEFSNNEKTIVGYVRWIPKFVTSTENDQGKLVEIDNYQPIVGVEPMPLTTKLLKRSYLVEHENPQSEEALLDQFENDDDDGDISDESQSQIAGTAAVENDDDHRNHHDASHSDDFTKVSFR